MGCSASANISQAVSLKSIQIVTESGKTFLVAYDKYLRISQIKSHMEMRIASNSNHLRLFLKIENQNQNNGQANTSNIKIAKQIEESSQIITEGEKAYKQIELDDNQFLLSYSKFLQKNPYIYLVQDKAYNNTQSNESVSTSVNSNGQKNQTISIGSVKSETALHVALEKLENGEQISQSQIDIIQRGECLQKQQQQQQQQASPKPAPVENNSQLLVQTQEMNVEIGQPEILIEQKN